MINLNETRLPPNDGEADRQEPGATRLPEGDAPDTLSLGPGDSLAGSYIVHAPLSVSGRQAEVYLVNKAGHPFVIKFYHKGWRPSGQLKSFLTGCRHPNLAHIIESGDHRERYFEIYEYYSEGTLTQQNQCAPAFIQKVIVPSINEGLRELHQNGIIHCDIKPDNLFVAQDRKAVVIGDYGISGYIGSEGKLVDRLRGTPEYAPRIKSHFGYASMSPAYDYGSLGLVLYRAATGHSLFEGMNLGDIARTWERGIILPVSLPERLLELIQGLLQDEEEKRWGYREVKHWCEGDFVRTAAQLDNVRRRRAEKPVRPLIFGRFDGQTIAVSSLEQLAQSIRDHWEHTGRLLKRRELINFLHQFDQDHTLAVKVSQLTLLPDPDEAIFKLLYTVKKDNHIFFRSRNYGTLTDFIEHVSSHPDPDAVRFVVSGLLIEYLRFFYQDHVQLDVLERIIRKDGLNDLAAIRTICYSLGEQKHLIVENHVIETLGSFVDYIAEKTTEEIAGLAEDSDVIAWLYYHTGFRQEVIQMASLQEGMP